MILNRVGALQNKLSQEQTWRSLSAFQNVEHTTRLIMSLHDIPPSQRSNVQKQARQIRNCLQQAQEYFRAASSVGMATRPLLLYYGLLSLALAEILLKQDGRSSLDAARGKHAHHGLILRLNGNPSTKHELSMSAASLAATPLTTPNGRTGTFELWHRSAREPPVALKLVSQFANHTKSESSVLGFGAADRRLELMPDQGITLIDCMRSHPECARSISQFGVNTTAVRAITSREQSELTKTVSSSIFIQPAAPDILEACYGQILFGASAVNTLNISEFRSGMGIRWSTSENDPQIPIHLPVATQSRVGEFFMQTDVQYLNEFGILYVGLYILGNYARYYPDYWMNDVDSSSALALAAHDFVDVAEDRAPLLALGEFERRHLVLDS